VDAFDLLSFDPPDAPFRVICSGGTYVRVLAAEVGAALSCGAHLTALRRTAIGPYTVEDAIAPDAVSDPLPIGAAVGHLPRLDVEEEEAAAASHGRPLGPAGIAGPYGVFAPDGRLIGIYEDDGPRARPQVILASD
jgi:tRNA pseudouridine55 synthase